MWNGLASYREWTCDAANVPPGETGFNGCEYPIFPDGVLVTVHFCWLPREDGMARASAELALRYNPHWSSADWSGLIPPIPRWAEGRFRLVGMFVFDALIPFARESWRGRMRACRGVGAAHAAEEGAPFDDKHARLLERLAPESFAVLHRIDRHILRPQPPA